MRLDDAVSPGTASLSPVWDFVVIGSGFGGAVSALRLAEKGYRVLVLERGKRFEDHDFARSTWNVRRYLWMPLLRCFGILEITPLRDVVALHGAGVGGGSLGYANVLMEPDDRAFAESAWRRHVDWRTVLRPHYATARRMLGVSTNPRLWPADEALREIANELGAADSFRPTTVGTFFGAAGEEGKEFADPYFGGAGPSRRTCLHCGACMVGCRHNAKNTLVKNYLWLAERLGVEVRAECEVRDIRSVAPTSDGVRYEVVSRRATAWLNPGATVVRARNVVIAAGALGTMRLLFRCRDVTRSLPNISARLGDDVRTNSEALLGSVSRSSHRDYSRGVAITSSFMPDATTTIEPVRYPAGSSLMRFLSAPLVAEGRPLRRVWRTVFALLGAPLDALRAYVLPGWAQRATILLVMQHVDNRIRVRLGRKAFRLFRRDLVSTSDAAQPVPASIAIGHEVTRRFAARTNGAPAASVNESLLGVPMTAHVLGGCPFGARAEEGVVGLDAQVHGYPGLYVIDGSIVPANPGVNPSLTIAALAEHMMTHVPTAQFMDARRSTSA